MRWFKMLRLALLAVVLPERLRHRYSAAISQITAAASRRQGSLAEKGCTQVYDLGGSRM